MMAAKKDKFKVAEEKSTAGKEGVKSTSRNVEPGSKVTLKELEACCHYSLTRLVRSLRNERRRQITER